LDEQRVINSVNTLCKSNIQTLAIEYITIEIPLIANNIILCLNINDIDGTRLIAGIDYTITDLGILGTKTFAITLVLPRDFVIIIF
jgi:hypothetical protein